MELGIFWLIILGIIIFIFTSVFVLSDWLEHMKVTKKRSTTYGKATFDKFVEEFNKIKWKIEADNSLVDQQKSLSRIFPTTNILYLEIKFNDEHMLLNNIIDYWRFRYFLSRFIKNANINIKNTKIW